MFQRVLSTVDDFNILTQVLSGHKPVVRDSRLRGRGQGRGLWPGWGGHFCGGSTGRSLMTFRPVVLFVVGTGAARAVRQNTLISNLKHQQHYLTLYCNKPLSHLFIGLISLRDSLHQFINLILCSFCLFKIQRCSK